jgi:hypothetical protein
MWSVAKWNKVKWSEVKWSEVKWTKETEVEWGEVKCSRGKGGDTDEPLQKRFIGVVSDEKWRAGVNAWVN